MFPWFHDTKMKLGQETLVTRLVSKRKKWKTIVKLMLEESIFHAKIYRREYNSLRVVNNICDVRGETQHRSVSSNSYATCCNIRFFKLL